MALYPRLLFFLPSSSSSLSTNGFLDKCLEIVLYSRRLHILDIYPCFSSLAAASSRLRESPSPSESTQGFLASAMTWRLGFLHQPWRSFLWKDQAIFIQIAVKDIFGSQMKGIRKMCFTSDTSVYLVPFPLLAILESFSHLFICRTPNKKIITGQILFTSMWCNQRKDKYLPLPFFTQTAC